MTHDTILALTFLALLLLIATAHKPRLTVTVSPELEAAAVRVIQEHTHD